MQANAVDIMVENRAIFTLFLLPNLLLKTEQKKNRKQNRKGFLKQDVNFRCFFNLLFFGIC